MAAIIKSPGTQKKTANMKIAQSPAEQGKTNKTALKNMSNAIKGKGESSGSSAWMRVRNFGEALKTTDPVTRTVDTLMEKSMPKKVATYAPGKVSRSQSVNDKIAKGAAIKKARAK